MSFDLEFSDKAKKDIDYHKKSGNKAILQKIFVLLDELTEHPSTGTGKPESLKHELSGLCSRRINKEHRIVYEIKENIVYLYSLRGHY